MYLYLFRNEVNGKGYVGITMHPITKRRNDHLSKARRNAPTLFARALRKYGPDAFTMTLLAEAESWEELTRMEQEAIATYNTFAPTGHGYNMTLGGDGTHGYVLSAETKQRISEALTGRSMPPGFADAVGHRMRGVPKSAEQRARMSAAQRGEKHANYGKKLPASQVENMRQAQLRRAPASEETREKLRVANLGKTLSDEHRTKLSEAALARHARGDTPSKGIPKSEEHRAKLSAATTAYLAEHGNPMQGRTHSAETRAKIAAKARGRRMSEETKAKVSATLTGRPSPTKGMTFAYKPRGPASEETKQKLSASRTGGKNWKARAIEYDGVTYPSIMDAVRATGLSRMQMSYRIKLGYARYLDDSRKEEAEQLPLL